VGRYQEGVSEIELFLKLANPNMSPAKVLLTNLEEGEEDLDEYKGRLTAKIELPKGEITIDPIDALLDVQNQPSEGQNFARGAAAVSAAASETD